MNDNHNLGVAYTDIAVGLDSRQRRSAGIANTGSDRIGVEEQLMHLAIYNCARYRLTIPAVERWIAAGRPGIKHAACNLKPRA
jgi:hypothetical protein